MIKALKALVGLAHREDALTVELAPSIPAAEAELATARAALDAAEIAYRQGLLNSDDAALQRLAATRADAQVRVDRVVALVEALRERLADARAREAEAERVGRYEKARAEADDARRALAEFYLIVATDLVNLIEVVARAEVEVQQVNADLPAGAEPLLGVEHEVRDLPGEPDQVVSERTVQRWVKVGQIMPGTFDQSNIYETVKGQRGVIMIPGIPLPDCTECELRTFTEQQIQPGRSRAIAYMLAQRVAGDPPRRQRPVDAGPGWHEARRDRAAGGAASVLPPCGGGSEAVDHEAGPATRRAAGGRAPQVPADDTVSDLTHSQDRRVGQPRSAANSFQRSQNYRHIFAGVPV